MSRHTLLANACNLREYLNPMLAGVVRAIAIATALGLTLSLVNGSTWRQLSVLSIGLAYWLTLIVAQRRGHFTLCVNAVVFGLILISAMMAASYGSPRGMGGIILLVAITAGGIFLERGTLTVAVIASVCWLGALVYAQNAGWLPVPNYKVGAAYWAGFSVVMILAALALSYMRAALMEMNAELERRVEERTCKLNSAVERLEEANRDLDSFNFSIAHDLRQPLNAIEGFAELLQEPLACADEGEARRFAREIQANAARMEQMIAALLRFSSVGRDALKLARVDMSQQVEATLRDLTSAAPQRLAVFVGDLPPALGDESLLRHVWANLIGNALKYSSKDPAPRIEISGRRDGGTLEYVVRDNGVGFDMSDAKRMFGVFERLPTSAEFEGTGVGLAIVQRIVRRHGGQISAESQPGCGATFRFRLPDPSARRGAASGLPQINRVSRPQIRSEQPGAAISRPFACEFPPVAQGTTA